MDKRLLEVYDKQPSLGVPLSAILLHDSRNVRQWWTRLNNFTRTHAQWSFLGYAVGLGDRHTDNILLT